MVVPSPLSSALPGQSKGNPQGGSCLRDPFWGMREGQLGKCVRPLLTPSLLSSTSDYVIDDKVAILQKRDHEGFGFVLRGAKGNEGLGTGVSDWQGRRRFGASVLPLCSPAPAPAPGVTPFPIQPPRPLDPLL